MNDRAFSRTDRFQADADPMFRSPYTPDVALAIAACTKATMTL